MREAFAEALLEAAQRDERVIVLTGDHGYSLFDAFRRSRPRQFLNAGVAEQNMVGVAAGLAKAGFRPIVYGLAAFIPVRVVEQIKLDICYENLPVLLIGDGAGLVYGTLGASHQSAEDVALTRALPNLAVLSPADAGEVNACMQLARNVDQPVYLRLGKADRGIVHETPPALRWGEPCRLRSGNGRIAFLATGSMAITALNLAARIPDATVWSVPFLKPMNAVSIADICRSHAGVITLEEHSHYGGLGSAIAEVAGDLAPTWVLRLGVADSFSRTCGSHGHLLKEHGLDEATLWTQVDRFLDKIGRGDLSKLKDRVAIQGKSSSFQ